MKYLPRLVILALMMPGCRLALSDAPDGGPLADAGAAPSMDVGTARPSVDASVEPPADAGAARPYDAGPRGEVPTCGAQQRLDEDSHLCVPLSGTTLNLPRRSGAAPRSSLAARCAERAVCGAAGSR